MTLTEFLDARITEDELTAQAATDISPHWVASYDYRDVKDDGGHFVVAADPVHPTREQAAHIARHDPERTLRECEAKRAMIAELLRRDAVGDVAGGAALLEVLQLLAAVHRDHPDYQPQWRSATG